MKPVSVSATATAEPAPRNRLSRPALKPLRRWQRLPPQRRSRHRLPHLSPLSPHPPQSLPLRPPHRSPPSQQRPPSRPLRRPRQSSTRSFRTSCATSSPAATPIAISHAATNAPPPKHSTSSAITSRYSWQTASSRRAAADVRRLSAECRRRRSRSVGLSGPDLQGRRPRRAGRGRASSDRRNSRICPPRLDRPRAFLAHQQRHRLRAGRTGTGRNPREGHGRGRYQTGAGFLSAAASAIQKAEGRTRQGTRPQREARRGSRSHSGRRQAVRQCRRSARPAAAQAAQDRGRCEFDPLRSGCHRGGEEIPAGRRPLCRRRRRPRHAARAQRHGRAEARAHHRHHHRQYGSLALDAARSRQELRDAQHPRISPAPVSRTRSCIGRPRSLSASPRRRPRS